MTRILTHERHQPLRAPPAPLESREGSITFNNRYQCMSAVGEAVILCKTQNNTRQSQVWLLAACLPLIISVTAAHTQLYRLRVMYPITELETQYSQWETVRLQHNKPSFDVFVRRVDPLKLGDVVNTKKRIGKLLVLRHMDLLNTVPIYSLYMTAWQIPGEFRNPSEWILVYHYSPYSTLCTTAANIGVVQSLFMLLHICVHLNKSLCKMLICLLFGRDYFLYVCNVFPPPQHVGSMTKKYEFSE